VVKLSGKIQTLHPDPSKQGVNIERTKYEAVKTAIVEILKSEGELSFRELMEIVGHKLSGRFEGSIGWYYTTVKLDLEARGIIERVPNRKPQKIRLI